VNEIRIDRLVIRLTGDPAWARGIALAGVRRAAERMPPVTPTSHRSAMFVRIPLDGDATTAVADGLRRGIR
jgi:hypothetical protein